MSRDRAVEVKMDRDRQEPLSVLQVGGGWLPEDEAGRRQKVVKDSGRQAGQTPGSAQASAAAGESRCRDKVGVAVVGEALECAREVPEAAAKQRSRREVVGNIGRRGAIWGIARAAGSSEHRRGALLTSDS